MRGICSFMSTAKAGRMRGGNPPCLPWLTFLEERARKGLRAEGCAETLRCSIRRKPDRGGRRSGAARSLVAPVSSKLPLLLFMQVRAVANVQVIAPQQPSTVAELQLQTRAVASR